jgi:membrane protease YdiL (CAAX protease family)
LTELRLTFTTSAAFSTILFALGHLYQGLAGVTFAMLHGLLFAYAFQKRRSIHMLALSHALYNLTVLLLGTFTAVMTNP